MTNERFQTFSHCITDPERNTQQIRMESTLEDGLQAKKTLIFKIWKILLHLDWSIQTKTIELRRTNMLSIRSKFDKFWKILKF